MSSARQDAKHEKILRELLKQPDNKRCPNCESLGPQYVVSQFNIFVCTVCSGVHRQFGHRVKGVSMSTFKPEEIKALQEGGNGPFLAHYLAKWTQSQLPKPTDRNVDRIREWIQAVYEGKRFFDADKQYAAPAQRLATHSTKSEGKEVLVRQLSDVLGGATPKLVVSRTDSLDKSPAKAAAAPAAPVQNAGHIVNLLDVASPKAAAPKSPAKAAAPAAPEPWDAFGVAPTPAAAAPAATDGWAAFGDTAAPAATSAPAAAAAASPAPTNGVKQSPAAQAPSSGGWEAFGEPAAAAPAPSAAAAPAAPASPSPAAPQQPQPKKEERREVPLDIFFPEFEQIRATGLLPNGQPAPMPRPPQYGGYAQPAYGMQQPAYMGGHPGYGYAQQPAAGMYQAPPRPTVVIPAAPVYAGGVLPSPMGGVLPSPAGMPSPGGYSTYSPQSGLSPAGSAGSFHQTQTNGGLYGQHADPMAALRSSTSSETGIAAAAPQAAAADPFSSLAPGFKSALPTYAPSRPAPAPPAAAPYAAGVPAPYSAAPSPAAPAPAAAGSPFGSSSLFSGPPSLSAMPYDLSAPAAPKPKASGNPFA